jgi:amino acid adenylation domain-containing protein
MGLSTSNRNQADFQQVIGCLATVSPVWLRLGMDLNAMELLKAIDSEWQDNCKNQPISLTELNRRLGLPQANRSQLFEITLSYVKYSDDIHFHDQPAYWVSLSNGFQIQALAVRVEEFLSSKSVTIHFDYHLSAFTAEEMELIKTRLAFLLSEIIRQPLVPIRSWQIMPAAELNQILYEFNDTAADYPKNKCLHHLFEEQVERTPNAIAVVFEEQSLTYATLNQQANQLARHLQTLGVKPEVLVGISVERSVEIVIGLLGILKAGGAYVPLDPAYPTARLALMLADANVSVLLTLSHLKENLPSHHASVVCLDSDWKSISQLDSDNLDSGVQAENLAYVIYTSGSTGKPKGVAIEHRSVVALLTWSKTVFTTEQLAGVLASTSLNFDLSVFELFVPLSWGGKIIVVENALHLPALSNDVVVTLVNTVPSVIRELTKMRGIPSSVRVINLAGEPLQNQLVQQIYQQDTIQQVFNLYGPSEDTTYSTFALMAKGSLDTPSIGCPITNTQIYILDTNHNPTPLYVSGELCIAGAGLARGYLNRPELTAEKFIEIELFGQHQRIYKTGDLARWLPNGNLEYLGRLDNQIKLRGFRIELGEIEATLRQHPVVQEAVVLAEEHEGNQQLIAYLVCNSTPTALTPATEGSDNPISQWEQIYDDAYNQAAAVDDPTFNISGWNDSYTGQLIPAEDIREWVDSTVARILNYHPQRILEIGCGTGLLLFRLAPHCTWYAGTDISSAGLRYIEQQLQQLTETVSWPPVWLYHQPAHDFTHLQAESVDMVIINSVVGHFPNIEYLVTVLENAVKLVSPRGVIFVGDVFSFPLRETLHAAVQLYQAPPALSKIQLYHRTQQQLAQEDKLVIAPEFFMALPQYLPRISQVSIQLKRGIRHNEMTRFRYDVTLHVDTALSTPETVPTTLNWQQDQLSLPIVQQFLAKQPQTLVVKSIPNVRIQRELKISDWLTDEAGPATVAAMREILATLPPLEIPDPEAWWKLADDLPYEVYLTPSLSRKECYHAVFQRLDELETGQFQRVPQVEEIGSHQPWSTYANNPQQWQLTKELVPQLRTFLRTTLPDYMIPAAFVILSALPLTPNGKVDRRALSVSHGQRYLTTTLVTPRTPTEEKLAAIWATTLGIEAIGVHDNFFELGGHSLQATQVISRIRDSFSCEVSLHDLFELPTIAQLSEHLAAADSEQQLPPITPLDRDQPLPLSFAQQRLWFLEQLEGEGAMAYHESWALVLEGSLHRTALEQSLQAIVQRHEVLRTTFPMVAGKPVQKVQPFSNSDFKLATIDLSNWPLQEREAEEQRLFKAEIQRPLNLSLGPLFRATLFSRAVDTHILLLAMHHIIFDGWSQAIFIEELSTCYQAFFQDQQPSLPPLTIQYADFANWQRQWLVGERLKQQVDYWQQQLAGAPALLPLPTDLPRPPIQRFRGASCSIHLSAELTEQLQSWSNQTGATLFMTLLSGFAILLARYSGQTDIVIGSPIANRTHSQIESLIGFFVNTLVLRLDLSGNPSVAAVWQQARRVALAPTIIKTCHLNS